MVFSFLIIQTLLLDSHETGWEIQLDVAKFQFYTIMIKILYF